MNPGTSAVAMGLEPTLDRGVSVIVPVYNSASSLELCRARDDGSAAEHGHGRDLRSHRSWRHGRRQRALHLSPQRGPKRPMAWRFYLREDAGIGSTSLEGGLDSGSVWPRMPVG